MMNPLNEFKNVTDNTSQTISSYAEMVEYGKAELVKHMASLKHKEDEKVINEFISSCILQECSMKYG